MKTICQRPGCERPVAKGRRRYCSAECARIQGRANARVKSREHRDAQKQRTKALYPGLKERECLGVGCMEKLSATRMFLSTGPGNRICPKCQGMTAW